jgi:hypothetical protein
MEGNENDVWQRGILQVKRQRDEIVANWSFEAEKQGDPGALPDGKTVAPRRR